ncbi:MAG: shikimate kinase [Halobacteriaceae archaeon]
MKGSAKAPAAGTIINALATGTGSAFAIDEYIEAKVELTDNDKITGHIQDHPDVDTTLIERCVETVLVEQGIEEKGAIVETKSDVPIASGLKTSSAAANATILATFAALGKENINKEQAAKMGVEAARDVGVTVTGAFDDASASMLGGLTITNNQTDTLLYRDEPDWSVLIWSPPSRVYSQDADLGRCQKLQPIIEHAIDIAKQGIYGTAMTINGFGYCNALEFDTDPLFEALPEAHGVSLSGTGPSYMAIGKQDTLQTIKKDWSQRQGDTWITRTQEIGATLR